MDFLRKFITGQEDIPNRIEEALKADDRLLAERLAHTLRGVAGNIGADGVQEVAAELELSIGKNDSAIHTKEILTRFSESISLLILNLKKVICTESESGEKESLLKEGANAVLKEGTDPVDIKNFLIKLAVLLEKYDSEAVDYFESIKNDLFAVMPH
ncbi:MAG: Hpt domain-containing protein, partial [Desulfamplus sp.]|nr:Hpt domain-containing protein [Desulfamplus sp.]